MTRVMVGTYAAKGSPGITPITRDDSGWAVGTPMPHLPNASWIVAAPRTGLRYVVDEMANTVAVCRGPRWEKVATIATAGGAPCHLALAHDGGALAIANYTSGSVTRVALDEAGLPLGVETRRGTGGGPNPGRQDGPQAHWVGFDARGAVIHVDLGADRIMLDHARTLYAAPAGSGPRHLVMHPWRPLAYLVSELASTLTVLGIGGDAWSAIATLSTLPADADGDSLVGEIALDASARRLFVTNRGHDSVATFALDHDGMPSLVGHIATGGASPRFVLPLATELLVAHEGAGGVTVLPLGDDRAPGPVAQRLDVPGAAFLMIDEGER